MRFAAIAVLVLVLTVGACQSSPTAARITPGSSPTPSASPAVSPSPSPAPVVVSPSPTASPLPPVGFACHLPVAGLDDSGALIGGYITFPAAAYAGDPTAVFKRDHSNGTYRWLSTQSPQLIGGTPRLFYDKAFKRWLPSPRAAVYPDGSRYAYVTGALNQTVHIVTVATGKERVLAAPHPINGAVLDFSPSGIYLAGSGEGSETGIWLLNQQTGAERLISGEKIVVAINGGGAWLEQSPTGAQFPDTLVLLNLTTGAKTVWFKKLGAFVNLVGLTADGLPVVQVNGPVYLLRSPAVRDQIYSGGKLFADVASDTHGLWTESSDGVYLALPGKTLRLVASDGQGLVPSGSCV